MEPLLTALGVKVLADLVSKMIMGGLKWAKDRPEEEPGIIELKLGKIAARALPDSIPEAKREAVITSLVDIVMPTFEQVVQFSPNTARVINAAGRTVAKKAVAKKAVARVGNTRKAPVYVRSTKKQGAPGKAFKKSVPVKHVVKKAASVKKAAKKAVAKKAPAKKMARRR